MVDGAHNPAGAARLVESLDRYAPGRAIVGIVGASLGKDVAEMLRVLAPRLDGLIAVEARHPRAFPASKLAALARAEGIRLVETASSLEGALASACRLGGPSGGVCVAGSLYLVGDLLEGWPRWRKSFRLGAASARSRPAK